jgi:uncharacterized 2Fe-2S/4Fe-4S cluster protein (DUF4445 family)
MATLTIDGRKVELVVGRTLFDHADEADVRIPSSCPRIGACHECIVQVREGLEALEPPTEREGFLTWNFRLACQARVARADMDIEVATLKRRRQILVHGRPGAEAVELDPMTVRRGDMVVHGDQELGLCRERVLGIAADVGTTTVVLDLVDLETGELTYTAAFENPQVFAGSNVIHRVHYDEAEATHGQLQRVLVAYINKEIAQMPCDPRDIFEIVVVGNTTMRDLFFRIDVRSIGQKPFKSLTQHQMEAGERASTSVTARAADLGLHVNPNAIVYGLPLIGCHVGADAAAALLVSRMYEHEAVEMLIDIGTNTEVFIGNRSRILAASCAAGPAFEGQKVKYGMPGVDGAIETVRICDGRVNFRTIGGVSPQGICGSGLIDLLAELLRTGAINRMGRFTNHRTEFVVSAEPRVTFSEADINELSQAKAANYAGQKILMKNFGATAADVRRFCLAGGFANYIDVANARAIGLLPGILDERILKIGNAAAEGAREVLLSRRSRQTVEEIVRRVEHVELEADPDFFDHFVDGCMFAPM